MAEYILLIDSNDEEAEGFVRGLEEATASPWEVELYPNNKTYGLRRYLKFFTVALHVVTIVNYFNKLEDLLPVIGEV